MASQQSRSVLQQSFGYSMDLKGLRLSGYTVQREHPYSDFSHKKVYCVSEIIMQQNYIVLLELFMCKTVTSPLVIRDRWKGLEMTAINCSITIFFTKSSHAQVMIPFGFIDFNLKGFYCFVLGVLTGNDIWTMKDKKTI